jgi:alkanesulfonate monooxygenase SsuD/methylene tetrahydromethanopterin reductase-like flavin-dependent oxidoreductase (luciferase family)
VKLCVNWLPISPALTRGLAAAVEQAGLYGLGIGDSPNYGELYAACAVALDATERIKVITSVTNPVTRHVSVHASAARTFEASYPGRFTLGIGRGDSAVRTFGLRPATTAQLDDTLRQLRASVPSTRVLVAASGPATAAVAGRHADGIIAGVGADEAAVAGIRAAARPGGSGAPRPIEVWASVRLAVARSAAEVPALRARLVPRAVSASHFAFSGGLSGKHIPEAFRDVMEERYAKYDYAWHGRSGQSPNATLFSDRPDIEDYLLSRFAVVGTAEDCREQLTALQQHVDGIFLSLLFEDVLDQFARVAELFAPEELAEAGSAPC